LHLSPHAQHSFLRESNVFHDESGRSPGAHRPVITTVQGEHSQHMSRCLTIEFPAKQLKSRKETGETTPILLFLIFGRLFHIFYPGAHIERGKRGEKSNLRLHVNSQSLDRSTATLNRRLSQLMESGRVTCNAKITLDGQTSHLQWNPSVRIL
jgi:hypothetical protein